MTSPTRRRHLRDRDTADLLQRLTTASWAGAAGVLLGMFVGVFLATRLDWPLLPAMLASMVAIGGTVYTIARLTTAGAARAAGTIHNPSGHSTPYRFDYSQPAALVAQGDYRGAVVMYRDAITDNPANPELQLRLARLLRDHLQRYDDAWRVFRSAREVVPEGSRLELLLTRELVEMALDKMQDPPRAAAELARLIERFPGSPEANWARAELGDIKQRIGAE